MSEIPTRSSAPMAVIDVLNGLLDAELNSIFRFMGEGSPYLSRATAEVRQPLAEMVVAGDRRAGELYDAVEMLGGTPMPRSIEPEEQYLAYLSLKFLLPKLVDAKKLAIERYENALRAIGGSHGAATELLTEHLAEHQGELSSLEKAASHVASQK